LQLTIDDILILATEPLRTALRQLDEVGSGTLFVVDTDGRLVGSITDGDVRRAVLNDILLTAPVTAAANKNCVSHPVDTDLSDVAGLFKNGIDYIPLLDDTGVVVDYAAYNRLRRLPVMEPHLRGNEEAYVLDCVRTKWISSQGKYVTQFERMFAERLGVPEGHAVAVANGTVALHLALVVMGIGPGDEVIVPDLTFAASANAILHAGATPVIVDVRSDTWCIDPDAIEAAITPQTRAIMPVHLYGKSADMATLQALAARHGLRVIEDTAEAFGARCDGRTAGTAGDASAFSFFGNKIITTGEGGMVTFRDSADVERARVLRDHGMSKTQRYWHDHVGYNYRMTNLQAAIGVAQLEQFDDILHRKLEVAAEYTRLLSGIAGITLPPDSEPAVDYHGPNLNVFWLYTVLLDVTNESERSTIIKRMNARGIETRPMFYPMSAMPLYASYARGRSNPVSAHLSARGLSLPSSTALSTDDIARVCRLLVDECEAVAWARGQTHSKK